MSIPCPPIQWPSGLEETGPPEDPTILLSGTALVGSMPFRITAIRVEPRLRFMPDYRQELEGVYDRETLETLLEELGMIGETDHPHIIELAPGSYVMWMTSAGETV